MPSCSAASLAFISAETLVQLLRRDLPGVVIASVFLASGIASLLLYRVKRQMPDQAPLWFSLFATAHGLRLFATARVVAIAVGHQQLLNYVDSVVTYTIALPILLLLREIFPPWRRILRVLLLVSVAFALTGILSDLFHQRSQSLYTVNNLLVLLSFIPLLVAVFRNVHRLTAASSLRFGLVLFALSLTANNLAGLFRHRLPFNPEPLGFLALLISLGWIIAGRVTRNQERLVELDKELEIARRIQTSILPTRMPVGPHWDIAAHYQPMTAVAGDFYDFLIVDDHRIGILIADVSGHGVPTALIASMVKVAIAAQAEHADQPDQVLSAMNRTLCGNLQGQYVTAAYLYLDLQTGLLRYSAAGHPALFWLHSKNATAAAVLEDAH